MESRPGSHDVPVVSVWESTDIPSQAWQGSKHKTSLTSSPGGSGAGKASVSGWGWEFIGRAGTQGPEVGVVLGGAPMDGFSPLAVGSGGKGALDHCTSSFPSLLCGALRQAGPKLRWGWGDLCTTVGF